MVGHSFGEVAAAHVAGALSLSDAIRVIFHRSHLLQQEAQQAVGKGAMASVEMPLEEAKQALVGYEDRLSIAVNNSPTSVVLSGDAEALANVVEGESDARREAFTALTSLGYKPAEARRMLDKTSADLATTEDILREVLQSAAPAGA